MKKIAIIGPESTGKSHLAKELANYYGCSWVPEFAREYLQGKSEYSFSDVLEIAKGELELLNTVSSKNEKFIFFDTDLSVIKIWLEDKYNTIPDWISISLLETLPDFYILTDIDLPWEYDPQREDPNRRDVLKQKYVDLLNQLPVKWSCVGGFDSRRLENAVAAIEKVF